MPKTMKRSSKNVSRSKKTKINQQKGGLTLKEKRAKANNYWKNLMNPNRKEAVKWKGFNEKAMSNTRNHYTKRERSGYYNHPNSKRNNNLKGHNNRKNY